MSPLRYKTLLTFLPGMATVVNAFDSPHVQSSVYEMLMQALDTKLDADGLGPGAVPDHQALPNLAPSNGELTHELVEGESIHAEQPRRQTKSAATIF